ncbi:MAG: Ig-like domain-containing protein [Patescibacteria group bacterium]
MSICKALTECTSGLIQSITPAPGVLSCRNTAFIVTFAEDMQTGTLNATNIQLQKGGVGVPATLSVTNRQVTIAPATLLGDGTYNVHITGLAGGIASAANTYLSADWTSGNYTVGPSAVICKIARTEIVPATDLYTCSGDSCAGDVQAATPGNQHTYAVNAYDANNVPLTLVSTAYVWTQGDSGGSPGPSNVYKQGAAGAACPNNSTSSTYCSESLNVPNGQEQLSVAVTGTNSSGTGNASATVQSFLCSNPWPTTSNAWPYRDPDYNFTTAFCGDNVGTTTLALPVVLGLPTPDPDLLKEYFLFAQENSQNTGDAIGVRVHSNLGDLSPDRWYRKEFNKAPSGSTLEVDGYPAIREGRTVYVSATNCVDSTCDTIYPNIYVFSYSDNAKPETIKIFEQLLQNLRFNTNAQAAFDQAMLRRDTKRVHALNEMVYALDSYYDTHAKTYPKLESGSFLKGLTTSAWPSWQQALGQVLGINLPKDVAPKWDQARCPDSPGTDDTDQTTCWNQVTKKFTFPSDGTDPPDSHAIMYQYALVGTLDSSTLYATFEQNVVRNSSFGSVLTLWSAPGTDVCQGTSECFGFNVRISSGSFDAINTQRLYTQGDIAVPLVNIVLPSPAASPPSIQGTVELAVSATDLGADESGIANVAFTIRDAADKEVARTTVSTPAQDGTYHWSWNTRPYLNAVNYKLVVFATDKTGKSANTQRIYSLNNPPGDSRPPVITLGSPSAAGFIFNDTGTPVSASATDNQANDTGIAKIEFYLGTSLLGQALATGNPSSFTGNSSVPGSLIQQFPNDSYTYSVVAYDAYGNTAIKQLPVTVQHATETGAPTVSIVTPTATISGGFTDVIVDATDTGPGATGVDRVEFLVDGALSVQDFSQPYVYGWPHSGYANASSHTIQAVAYDRAGNQAADLKTVVYSSVAGPDTVRPTISGVTYTLAPNPAAALAGASLKDTVILNAVLTDNVAVLRAELRIDGNVIPLTGGSYSPITAPTSYRIAYQWNTLPELVGNHTITFVVYDTSNYVTTATALVTVDNQIVMTLSQPRTGTSVADNPTVPVLIDVTKTCRSDQLLNSVVFYLDNAPGPMVPQPSGSCTNGRCTYNWTTLTTTSNGTHTLKAIGTDSLGCKGGAKSVVTVANDVTDTTPPTLSNFFFDTTPWNTGSPVYIKNLGRISIDAADNVGGSGLSQVTIAVNGTTVATCGSSPCQYIWDPVEGANYTVTVNASDIDGNTATQQSQTVNVDKTPPTATWVAPANGSTVTTPPSILFQASATDALSGVLSVAFYRNGVMQGIPDFIGSADIYDKSLTPLTGPATYYAEAWDSAGNSFSTAPVTITVTAPDTTPPTVNIAAPGIDNVWYSGNVFIFAFATDTGTGVRDVEFFRDGVSMAAPDPTPTYSYTWDSRVGTTNGQTYSITARACDNAPTPNCATSTPRLIRIWNQAGFTACSLSLCSGATPNCCNGNTCSAVPCAGS